jgi:Uma2 family endonuclease
MVSARWPDHLLSLPEWDTVIFPDPEQRYELVEGVLVMVPRPVAFHQHAIMRLIRQLAPQLPESLILLPEYEIVTDARYPASVRVPDLVVVRTTAIADNPARLDADQVVLAVEVLSPGTIRTDRITKAAEYADAGIGAYWIVDLDAPVTLTAHVLVDGEYETTAQGSGRIDLLSPVELTVDLAGLVPRP